MQPVYSIKKQLTISLFCRSVYETRLLRVLSYCIPPKLQKLFDRRWHQLKILVRTKHVTCYMDDKVIQEVDLEPVVPIFINGKTQIAKHYNAEATIPVSSNKSSYCRSLTFSYNGSVILRPRIQWLYCINIQSATSQQHLKNQFSSILFV